MSKSEKTNWDDSFAIYREENRMDFYATMLGFLAKYLKQGIETE